MRSDLADADPVVALCVEAGLDSQSAVALVAQADALLAFRAEETAALHRRAAFRVIAAYRPQPADLAFVPKRYPSHDYTGAGTIVRVYAGEAFVGHLTRRTEDGAVGWDASADPSTPAGTVRRYVSEALRMGAGQDRPLDDVWDDLLASTQHADPYEGDLSTLVPRWPA